MKFFSIRMRKGKLIILDQTRLPVREKYVECKDIQSVWRALRTLQVRGAPLIGVFAGYGFYVGVKDFKQKKAGSFYRHCRKITGYLRTSRPTAVNLFWALERMERLIERNRNKAPQELKTLILREADAVYREELSRGENIARHGLTLIKSGDRILTHCNSGMLATSSIGTALGVIYKAYNKYRNLTVYADETRPLLQGARLTCWELLKNGIKPVLLCDNMAADLMRKKKIDKVIVGADRIAANGDTANKIGTYSLAVLCNYHKIPFYIAAPANTFDLRIRSGKDIPIEQRKPREVTYCGARPIAPNGVRPYNPAFDVTPAELITAIVTDKGILYPPLQRSITKLLPVTKGGKEFISY
jgi:methylthioribose-1-phosphate isomerase